MLRTETHIHVETSLTLTLFHSNGALYNCFMVMLCFTRMSLMVVMLIQFMLWDTCRSAVICCCSWWRRIALFTPTMFTMANSCCFVNKCWRPRPAGLLATLQKKCNQLLFYSNVLYLPNTVLKHQRIMMLCFTKIPILFEKRSIHHPTIQYM